MTKFCVIRGTRTTKANFFEFLFGIQRWYRIFSQDVFQSHLRTVRTHLWIIAKFGGKI